jgi:hypothetical protein
MNLDTILTAIKEGFDSLKAKDVKLGKQVGTDGKEMFYDGEMLNVGAEIFADQEMITAVEDGTYETETVKLVIKDGKVAEILELDSPEAEQEMKKDEEPVQMADNGVEAKVNEIMQMYVGEIAKAVASQLADFKTEMKKEEEEVRLAKADPNPASEVAPTSLVEKMFNELKKN